jgi:hypothetical protein
MLKVHWPGLNLTYERFADRSGNRATNITGFNGVVAFESVIAWGIRMNLFFQGNRTAAFSIMFR